MVPAGGAEGVAKVIDAEFAHFGCAAFDVGSLIANLIFAASLGPAPEVRSMIMIQLQLGVRVSHCHRWVICVHSASFVVLFE